MCGGSGGSGVRAPPTSRRRGLASTTKPGGEGRIEGTVGEQKAIALLLLLPIALTLLIAAPLSLRRVRLPRVPSLPVQSICAVGRDRAVFSRHLMRGVRPAAVAGAAAETVALPLLPRALAARRATHSAASGARARAGPEGGAARGAPCDAAGSAFAAATRLLLLLQQLALRLTRRGLPQPRARRAPRALPLEGGSAVASGAASNAATSFRSLRVRAGGVPRGLKGRCAACGARCSPPSRNGSC
jgi:hypothetical protein